MVTVKSSPSATDTRGLVTDHLGTPRIVADQTGNLAAVKRHDYLPFGEEIGSTIGGRNTTQGYAAPQSDGVRQQFTGYERDSATGLDFAQARYFGSSLGRFTNPDPLMASASPGDPQSFNRYVYVQNNPLTMTDPTGLVGDYYTRDLNYIGSDGKDDGKYYYADIDYLEIRAEGPDIIHVTNSKEFTLPSYGTSAFRGTPHPGLSGSAAEPLKSVEGIARISEIGSLIPGVGVPFAVLAGITRAGQGDVSGAGVNLLAVAPGFGILKRAPTLARAAGSADEVADLAKFSVYHGFDAQGIVRYVGITGREPAIRYAEHRAAIGTGKELLRFEVVEGFTQLTKTQARVGEQTFINQFGLQKNAGQLLNQRNSIDPRKFINFGIGR